MFSSLSYTAGPRVQTSFRSALCKPVIFTSSSRLAALPLKSVECDAPPYRSFYSLPLLKTKSRSVAGPRRRCRRRSRPSISNALPAAAEVHRRRHAGQAKRHRCGPSRRTVQLHFSFMDQLNKCGDCIAEGISVDSSVADSALAAEISGRIPMFAAATLSRFVFFTRYIASSARCKVLLSSANRQGTRPPHARRQRRFSPFGREPLRSTNQRVQPPRHVQRIFFRRLGRSSTNSSPRNETQSISGMLLQCIGRCPPAAATHRCPCGRSPAEVVQVDENQRKFVVVPLRAVISVSRITLICRALYSEVQSSVIVNS